MRIWLVVGFMISMVEVGFAQITLHRSDFVQVGDSITMTTADAESFEPGPMGANQTWNFSGLVDNGEPKNKITFVDPSTTSFAGDFPGANIGLYEQPEGNDNYSFYLLDDHEFTLHGVVGHSDEGQVLTVYDDVQQVLVFPFTFGDKVTDTFHSSYTSAGASIERTGDSETDADGYGTLVLPSGTFDNVLRFKSIDNIQDVISGFTIETKIVSYTWMSKTSKWPLLTYSIIDTNVAGQIIVSKVIKFQGGSPTSQISGKFLSHVTREGGGFQTRLYFRNHDSSSQTITLTPFSSSGEAGMPLERAISPGGYEEILPGELFGSDVSHFHMTGGDNVSATAAYQTASGNGASAHLHSTESYGTTFNIYPGEWDLVFDGMALVNRGTEEALITAEQVASDGSVIQSTVLNASLAAGAKQLSVFGSIFSEQAGSFIRVTATQPSSAIFLRGTPPGVEPAYLYANLPQTSPQNIRWIPHVTKPGGGFQTSFHFNNSASASGSLMLAGFLKDGTPVSPVQVDVPANTLIIKNQEELFGSTEVSHFIISGSFDIQVSAAYKVSEGLGASAHVNESSKFGKEFWIYPGETDYIFDGMAVVNLGLSPARITASLWGQDGNKISEVEITSNLAPQAKTLAVFGSLFPGQDGLILIESDQDIMPLFLRGTPPGVSPGYLFTNLPLE